MTEVWTKTYCSPFYEVSNLGNVRGVDRERPWRPGKTQIVKGIELKKRIEKSGYFLFGLTLPDGCYRKIRVHQLVYHSFNKTEPIENMVVDHIDGDKSNNRLDNLQFITQSENCAKGKKHTERGHDLPLYIHPSNSIVNKYRVLKAFGPKQKSFGSYPTIEEAVARRDELIKNNWNL